MRKVAKNFDHPPVELEQVFQEKLPALMSQADRHHFEGYGKAKDGLQELYHGKCAYCESPMTEAAFTIEHYRPKKGPHSYYWLGYEWSNLLPVCKPCNGPKGDRFPIATSDHVEEEADGSKMRRSARRTTPLTLPGSADWDRAAMRPDHPYLASEQPYLLHPEVDDPWAYFRVKETGQIAVAKGLMGTGHPSPNAHRRAQQTIELLRLDREALLLARREIMETLRDDFEKQLLETVIFLGKLPAPVKSPQFVEAVLLLAFKTLFQRMEKGCAPTHPYTLTYRSCWERLHDFFFPMIHQGKPAYRDLLEQALHAYRASSMPSAS
jgi:5-methylcytosine-specific restriction endonuclease McrA